MGKVYFEKYNIILCFIAHSVENSFVKKTGGVYEFILANLNEI